MISVEPLVVAAELRHPPTPRKYWGRFRANQRLSSTRFYKPLPPVYNLDGSVKKPRDTKPEFFYFYVFYLLTLKEQTAEKGI